MGYVGNQQTEGFSQVPAKQDLTGATGTSLTLTHAVASAEGIDLFINNVRQEPTTAYSVGADGVTVTLTGSVVATDDIYVVYNSLARQTSTHPSNQALQATSGTFSGDLTVDTNTLYVDSTNNRVGIGTSSPERDLHIKGASGDPVHLKLEGDPADYARIMFDDGTTDNIGELRYNFGSDYMSFNTNSAERLRIDSSGNVGIGTSSPETGYKLHINGDLLVDGDHTGSGGNNFEVRANPTDTTQFVVRGDGTVLVGTPSAYGVGTTFAKGANGTLAVFNQNYGNGFISHQFRYNGSAVGSIVINTSSTAYNTSSDYRLKTAVTYDWDATTRLKQLRPARFEWISDGDDAVPVDGFLAHEVQTVVPEAISGIHNEVDDEGNPVYQGIDQSKLVPLLVKTIQELEARIVALEAN